MIVFNLICPDEHKFEGWFASSDVFERQLVDGLVTCPMCGDANIRKALAAPRLNLGGEATRHAGESVPAPEGDQAYLGSQHMLLTQFKRFILANTENVGAEFAERARRMHYGEEDHRNIRGKVSRDEAAALNEEGIASFSLPPELMLDESVQ
ncbi:MAG: DUF1178 family protein [Betaproteobacteria bacterium]|nr:DUF1178 family protein [Betaproteobacteria bacterium]